MVPSLSIAFMAVATLFAICLPVGLFLFWRKKYELKIAPMLVGAAAFIVFAMVLEQLLHMLVLRPDADGTVAMISENPALFVLYGIFAAGIFEESARFISFKLLKKKFDGVGTALSYGIGHGGIEAVILLGVAGISNIALSIMINSGTAESLVSMGITPEITAVLVETNPPLFLVSALERLFAVAFHISMSVLVWLAVTQKGKVWLYPAAILLHAAFNVPAGLMQAGIVESILLVETIVGVSALAICLLTVYVYRRFSTGQEVQ